MRGRRVEASELVEIRRHLAVPEVRLKPMYAVTEPDQPMYQVGARLCESLRGCRLIRQLLLRGW